MAQHRHPDYVNQPRDEFGRPVPARHAADKPWHEYRPAIAAAAEPSVRLSHPPPPGTFTACYHHFCLFTLVIALCIC